MTEFSRAPRRARLTRGLRAAWYLFGAFLSAMLMLGLLPVLLLLTLLVPPFADLMGQIARGLRLRAGRWLGRLPEPPPGPRTRRIWSDPGFWRTMRLFPIYLPLSLLTGLVALLGVTAIPGALSSMVLWPLQPGEFTAMGVELSNWAEALTLGPAQLAVGLWLLGWAAPAVADWHARTVWQVFAPSQASREAAELAARVDELTRTRAGAVDSHGAELRRIERDLHDGTQAQLVSLAMRLGVAKQTMATDPERAAALLDDARAGAEQAMTELREVLRTMYPPILADRGLAGAVSALGARCPVPTQLRIGELGQVPAAVEAAAYFVIAESLTNIAKHSAAGHADVLLERRDTDLYLAVTDDGAGGADSADGTGLAGITHRVEAIDGRVRIDSPIGGPTVVEAVLPCGS